MFHKSVLCDCIRVCWLVLFVLCTGFLHLYQIYQLFIVYCWLAGIRSQCRPLAGNCMILTGGSAPIRPCRSRFIFSCRVHSCAAQPKSLSVLQMSFSISNGTWMHELDVKHYVYNHRPRNGLQDNLQEPPAYGWGKTLLSCRCPFKSIHWSRGSGYLKNFVVTKGRGWSGTQAVPYAEMPCGGLCIGCVDGSGTRSWTGHSWSAWGRKFWLSPILKTE